MVAVSHGYRQCLSHFMYGIANFDDSLVCSVLYTSYTCDIYKVYIQV